MYQTMAARKFTQFAKGMASLEANQNIMSITGTILDPPPVPPAQDSKTMIKRQKNPIKSALYSGKTSLWVHTSVS